MRAVYKVFIVDDEKVIAKGIEKIIDWRKIGCATTSFSSSLQAYEALLAEKPDILVTDIKMPHMDGLELIEKLHSEGVKPEVIILSGFSEFEYARKGIELGVNSYILKPIELEALEKAVRKIVEKIKRKTAFEEEVKRLKLIEDAGWVRFRDIVLQDVVNAKQYMVDEILELTGLLDLEFEDSYTLCAAAKSDNANPAASCGKFADRLNEFMEVFLPELGLAVRGTCFKYSDDLCGIVLNGQDVSRLDARKIFLEVGAKLAEYSGTGNTMGIGDVQKSISGISKSFQQALISLRYIAVKCGDKLIAYSDVRQERSRALVPREVFLMLEEGIEKNDFKMACKAVDEAFDIMLSRPGLTFEALQAQCIDMLIASTRRLSYVQLQLVKDIGRDVLSLSSLSRLDSHVKVKNWIINVIRNVIEIKMANTGERQERDIIDDIKEFIDKHYNENISLARISERFFFNPCYLSQLFKKKTGQTFINYLTQKRIEQAKKLLAKENLKIYEVCNLVGYENVKHFSTLFKKITGVKPCEYRSKNFIS